LRDGIVKCWGDNYYGALGTGSTSPSYSSTPVQATGLVNIGHIGMSRTGGCSSNDILLPSSDPGVGRVKCWGAGNPSPQLINEMYGTPTELNGQPCARSEVGGFLYCWGDNSNGTYGDGTTTTSTTPVQHPKNYDLFSKGWGFMAQCGYVNQPSHHELWCWGDNNYGEVGTGTTSSTPVKSPTLISDITDTVISLAVSQQGSTCAALSTGKLKCWGYNSNGILGDGSTEDRYAPTDVLVVTNAKQVSMGTFRACARTSTGGIFCWGAGNQTPEQVTGLSTEVSYVTVGENHTCVLMTDGRVKCWGDNNLGQLGVGDTDSHDGVVDVIGL